MSYVIEKLIKRKLINPPKFLSTNTVYEVIMGSVAYGVSQGSSDNDIYGFAIPYKEDIFPHLRGEIEGFGKQKQRFDQFQQHHIKDEQEGKSYDITIYNIVRYFQLCMENNPNMVDSLFVPDNCVLFASSIGQKVRENRRIFLHRGSWHKFKGYCFSQKTKMKNNSIKADKIRKFENDHNLDHSILFKCVEEEIKNRKLI